MCPSLMKCSQRLGKRNHVVEVRARVEINQVKRVKSLRQSDAKVHTTKNERVVEVIQNQRVVVAVDEAQITMVLG